LKNKFIDFSQLGKISAKNFKDFLVERDSLIFEDSMRDKSIQARIKVQRAILWITINRGFFAQLLSNLNIYGSSKIDPATMCTNGFNIVYHPDFVLKQSDAAIRFVLCHEVLHCVGDHMSRRGNRNPLLWNYAADYAINPILNAEVTERIFSWPLQDDGSRMGLYEEKYSGMRAEDIYDDIIKDQAKQDELEKMKQKNNLGEVEDANDDLPQPDYEEDVAQRRFQDEDEEDELGSGSEEKDGPGKPGDKPGDKPGQGPGKPGDKPGEGEGDKEGETNLIGKKVRITEGPDAGKEGIIKQILPNGDIIIE
jgi:hypothetical protein